jgi:hypothetical protein
MNGTERSVGEIIGACLRPATNERTANILDAVRLSVRELDAEIAEEQKRLDDLQSRRYDLLAEEDRIRGDVLAMEYHRAEANLRRGRTPETTQAAHRAFVRHIAATHIANGTVPTPGLYAEDIEAEMDAQRGEVRQ